MSLQFYKKSKERMFCGEEYTWMLKKEFNNALHMFISNFPVRVLKEITDLNRNN